MADQTKQEVLDKEAFEYEKAETIAQIEFTIANTENAARRTSKKVFFASESNISTDPNSINPKK